MITFSRTVEQVDKDLRNALNARQAAKREIQKHSQLVIDATRRIADLLEERNRITLPPAPDSPEEL